MFQYTALYLGTEAGLSAKAVVIPAKTAIETALSRRQSAARATPPVDV